VNLTVIRPLLKDQVATLVELPTVWEDEPRPFNPGAICILTFTTMGSQGWDECRTQQDLNQSRGLEMQDQWCGNRFFTLTVRVEALDQTDADFAYNHLSTVRDRFWFRGVAAAFRAQNLAITELETTVDLTAPQDDRNRSIAAFDVKFAARTSTLDPTRYPYIDPPPVTGTLRQP
jgi:hypothetical protein